MPQTGVFLALEIENFQLNYFFLYIYICYLCSKHSFWVHVRTAAVISKLGIRGYILHGHVRSQVATEHVPMSR